MKERPILFSGPMVRAILEGRKTQTRREQALTPKTVLNAAARKIGFTIAPELARYDYPVKGVPRLHVPMRHPNDDSIPYEDCGCATLYCPYGQPGDRLWVKETHHIGSNGAIHYRADYGECDPFNEDECGEDCSLVGEKWKPSIFMRREYSRITLEITGVRVERLNAITESDAKAEGVTQERVICGVCSHVIPIAGNAGAICPEYDCPGMLQLENAKEAYEQLWKSINGKGSWFKNPWVWVIEFKRVEAGQQSRAALQAIA